MITDVNAMATISERDFPVPTWLIHLSSVSSNANADQPPDSIRSYLFGSKSTFNNEDPKFASDVATIRGLLNSLIEMRTRNIAQSGEEVDYDMEEQELESLTVNLGNTVRPNRQWGVSKVAREYKSTSNAARTTLDGWRTIRESDAYRNAMSTKVE